MQQKPRKKQDDRLLKQLTRHERREQEKIREMILSEQLFQAV